MGGGRRKGKKGMGVETGEKRTGEEKKVKGEDGGGEILRRKRQEIEGREERKKRRGRREKEIKERGR
jgi:hypothetical protein